MKFPMVKHVQNIYYKIKSELINYKAGENLSALFHFIVFLKCLRSEGKIYHYQAYEFLKGQKSHVYIEKIFLPPILYLVPSINMPGACSAKFFHSLR